MILVDLDESYQNILKSSHIARKKVPLLWGQKSCFFSFAPKRYFSQEKRGTIHNCNTTRQGLSESPSYDLT
jgi:intergrase/recombinase